MILTFITENIQCKIKSPETLFAKFKNLNVEEELKNEKINCGMLKLKY